MPRLQAGIAIMKTSLLDLACPSSFHGAVSLLGPDPLPVAVSRAAHSINFFPLCLLANFVRVSTCQDLQVLPSAGTAARHANPAYLFPSRSPVRLVT